MEKTTLFENVPKEDREQMLRDQCFTAQMEVVKRGLTKEELADIKHEFSEDAIVLNEKKIALKKLVEEKKAEMKPLDLVQQERIGLMKNKYRESEEIVFYMENNTTNEIEVYDKYGEFLYSRDKMPSEQQASIFNINKTA